MFRVAPAARRAAVYALPCLLALALHWNGLTAWFRADDFAWLGGGLYINNFHDLLAALFAPQAQGTIRPLSERAFFMAGFALFGLDALPFKIVVFATQFASLVLAASIGARLTGNRAAGLCAACLWIANGSSVLPLGWTSVYNQVLCGFFLLLAFHFLLRFHETGARRYEIAQWIAFLLGLGALELAVVYPAIAAAYALLIARRHFRRTLPLFAASAAYTLLHNAAAPVSRTGDYGLHLTGSMLRTLAIYWTWSVGPTFLYSPFALPRWLLPAGVALVTLGLAAFATARLRAGARLPLFCLAWYLIVIAPVLPLRDHMTEYYVFLPVIGLAWLGGWAAAEAWRAAGLRRIAAVLLLAVYAAMALPEVFASGAWNRGITLRVRALVEGVAGAHERSPGKAILLTGVDSTLFWNGILDRPFRLFALDDLYLAPGSERRIDPHPDLGDISRYILPAGVVEDALQHDKLTVYDASGPRLRNITREYAALPHETTLPLRIDAASPLTSYLLGPEWYPSDGDHRWMPRRATLRIGAPAAPGASLYLHGQCPAELLGAGPLAVTVSIDGQPLPPRTIAPGPGDFELSWPLPASAAGKPQLTLTVEAARSFRPASDPRDLSLVFGWFEIR
ncbi:MAG: hypothetical protein KGN36_05045 [Acidobacteriota bacterium]|nr:hypothetical protein [Acidobacteriota bacterium]